MWKYLNRLFGKLYKDDYVEIIGGIYKVSYDMKISGSFKYGYIKHFTLDNKMAFVEYNNFKPGVYVNLHNLKRIKTIDKYID